VLANKTITANNVMTSFYEFAYKNGLIGTSKPYYCIDNENEEYYDICCVDSEIDPTSHNYNAKRLIGSISNKVKYSLNQ